MNQLRAQLHKTGRSVGAQVESFLIHLCEVLAGFFVTFLTIPSWLVCSGHVIRAGVVPEILTH